MDSDFHVKEPNDLWERYLEDVKGLGQRYPCADGDGGFSVTVCQDQAGMDESIQKARDWIAKNAAQNSANDPANAHRHCHYALAIVPG